MDIATQLPLDPAAAPSRPWTPWQRALRLLALDRSDLWLCVVYAIAIGVLSLITPIAVQTVVNTVSFASALQPLLVVTALVGIGLVFAGAMRVAQAYVVEALQERMLVRGVVDLSHRLLRARPGTLDRHHPAELSHRFFEMPTLQKTASLVFVEGIELVLKLAVGLPLLALYHPLLLAFSLVLVVAIGVVIFAFGRGALTTAIGESTAKYEAASWLEHLARMPDVFRGRSAGREADRRAELIARRYRDARRSHFRRLVRHLVGGIGIQIAGAIVLLGVGGMLVIQREVTLGQLVASELVFASIGAAMLKLHKQLEAAYDLMTSAHKLGALLDLPQRRDGGEPVVGDRPLAVTLHGTVGYPEHAVATAIELAIAAGERVAIVGEAGAGKTTVLDSIAGRIPLLDGRVELGGVDLRIADLDDVAEAAVVVREPEMVASSVLANLRLGRSDATLAELQHVLRALGLADAIAALPRGLETELLPSGRPLSRTQVRRLALARAVLARPRLLILDGALDELGLEGEALERALALVFDPARPWTLVLTSSDPSIRRRCDRAYALRAGRLEVSDG